MSGTGQKPPGRLGANRLALFEKPRGEVPEVVGSPPPYVPPGPPSPPGSPIVNTKEGLHVQNKTNLFRKITSPYFTIVDNRPQNIRNGGGASMVPGGRTSKLLNTLTLRQMQTLNDSLDAALRDKQNKVFTINKEPSSDTWYTITNTGTVPEVPGLVPQGSPGPRPKPRPKSRPKPKSIDELINAGLFQSCLNVLDTNADTYNPYDTVMLNQALLFFPEIPKGHIKKTTLELIKSILTESQPQNNLGTLQERRNALMLWPEAWNAMSVDQFADGIFALIGPETASNKDAYAYIRRTLQNVLHTDMPVLTLRDVITALNLNKDRDQDSYMGIPLSTYIHLKKILVRHTFIYNMSPLQKVIDTFNRLHGDPNMTHNSTTLPTINGAIVQTILFGIYDVHDPRHLVKEDGIVVGFARDFTNLWRSEQQVKAQVFLSGKTVQESLSGIDGYAEAKTEGKGLLGHETDIIDLYGKFRNPDPRHIMTWDNPEPRIVPIFSKLAKKYKEGNDKRIQLLNDTLKVIWNAPGPETPTFIHMFTDNNDFRSVFGIRRLGPIPGNQGYVPGEGYVPGGGFNITNPGINPYPGYSRETITGTAVTGQLGQLVARSSFDGTPLGLSTIEPIPLQAYINMQQKGKGGMRSKTRKGKGRRRGRTRKSKK